MAPSHCSIKKFDQLTALRIWQCSMNVIKELAVVKLLLLIAGNSMSLKSIMVAVSTHKNVNGSEPMGEPA